MKKLLFLTAYIGIGLGNVLMAQAPNVPPTEKEKQKFREARIAIEQKNYIDAHETLNKLLKNNPNYNEARAAQAELFLLQIDTANAIIQYQTIIKNKPDYSGLPYYYLGIIYQQRQQFAEAHDYFKKIEPLKGIAAYKKSEAKMRQRQCLFAPEAMRNPLPFAPQNLGDAINTNQNEYLPSISADGNTLIFTRRSDQEDFYISEKDPATNDWLPATALPFPINTNGNEGAHCLSPDGKQLYFTGCYRADGFGSCDIYVANRTGNTWGKPQNLGGLINSKTWETQPCISANGQELYFVSNREGGLGGSDIWVSKKDSTNNWAYPVNLGPVINTIFDDISPYIHPNNQDFYFASEGHTGLGSFDVFWAKRNADTDQYDAPKNLGYPINTTQSESSLSVSIDGKTGYFASERANGKGNKDIYKFDIPPTLRPDTAAYYSGTVIDARTNLPIDANIYIQDTDTKKMIYNEISDLKNGSFVACLLPKKNKNYLINATKSGYEFYSENINQNTPQNIKIKLKPLEKGGSLILRNIFFDTNAYTLQPQSIIEINKLLKYLQQQPKLKIEIQGHTDNVGNPVYNLKLSEQRAKALYDFLVQNGATTMQITHKGYGDKQPITTNDTEQNRRMNRRTQVLIIDF